MTPAAPIALFLAGCFAAAATSASPSAQATQPPNVVVLFADDLGYGDLGCQGHPTIATPHLDRMAAEGLRFTQFYAGASVCTPSRAALLTGRLPVRTGMCSSKRRVLFPDSAGGLPNEEITLAEALREHGYATACIGKWHLGHLPEHLPDRHGFDEHFILPYSNDMDRVSGSAKGRAAFDAPRSEYWNVPLIHNGETSERPAQQETLTQRYTDVAIAFIEAQRARPFFVYLPYTMVHVPLFASEGFAGKSQRGPYGDTVEEIDHSVGRILHALQRLELDNTLVVFTSDNGPWLSYGLQGGSSGLLRSGKGSTWEGGVRVPGIAWWPRGIENPGRTTTALASTMDLFATCVAMAGGALPDDRVMDSHDLGPVFRGANSSTRDRLFHYHGTALWAVRVGAHKAHFHTKRPYTRDPVVDHEPPLLFDIMQDPSEAHPLREPDPAVLERIARAVAEHRSGLQPAPTVLEAILPK